MKRKTVLYVMGALLILVAVVVVLNFTLRGSRYETAIPVRGYVVSKGSLQDRVSGNGTFIPKSSVSIVARVSGQVQSIRVSEGDRVQEGAVLLTLRDTDYQLAADKAKAALDSSRRGVRQSLVTLRAQYRAAVSTLTDAQRTADKNKELFGAKSISEETFQRSSDALDSAKVNLQSAREQLDLRCGLPLDAEPTLDGSKDAQVVEESPEVQQAALALRAAQDDVGRCVVTTPVAGTVTKVQPSVGDMIAPSSALARIEDQADMLAEIQVDEVDIGKIHIGQPAEITSDSLIGLTLKGKVDTIAPTITSVGSTRVSLVDVRIDGASLREGGGVTLRSGASCTARITTSIKQDALLIPLASFVTEENVTSVFLLSPSGKKNAAGVDIYQLAKKEIKTGVSDVSDVEVTSGLADGQKIALGNLRLLRDGILVTLRADQATP
jgi:HlyD family secretion protein